MKSSKTAEIENMFSHPIEAHGIKHYFAHKSLYCLNNKNKVRVWCVWLVTWSVFENVLTFCICVNAVNIAT